MVIKVTKERDDALQKLEVEAATNLNLTTANQTLTTENESLKSRMAALEEEMSKLKQLVGNTVPASTSATFVGYEWFPVFFFRFLQIFRILA
jgi:hypothetical protein